MSELFVSLIQNYETGMCIDVAEGIDIFWAGERLQFHCMVDNVHVWIEQNDTLNRFMIGFGERPKFGEYLTRKQAIKLLFNRFGGVQ